MKTDGCVGGWMRGMEKGRGEQIHVQTAMGWMTCTWAVRAVMAYKQARQVAVSTC